MNIDQIIELQEQAWHLQSEGKLEEAALACREALRLVEEAEGDVSPDIANLLNDLAEIESDRQNFRGALELAKRAQAITDTLGDNFTGETAGQVKGRTLRLLGTIHTRLSDYVQAETVLQTALAAAVAEFGEASAETAAARNDLGVLYKHWGGFDEALQLYEQALHSIDAESPQAGTLHHNIGGILHAQGKYAAAEAPARKAWDISRTQLGEEDPRTMVDAVAYAAVLDGLERYGESEPIYRTALRIIERVQGTDHFEIAAILHNLAALLAAHGRYAEAEQAYRRALVIKENLLGHHAVETALTRHNLGSMLCSLGRRQEALPLLESAVAVLEKKLMPCHPGLVRARENLKSAIQDNKAELCACLSFYTSCRHGRG